MKLKAHLPILVLFTAAAATLLIILINSREHEVAITQLKLSQFKSGLGGVVAILSAVLLLVRAAAGHTLPEVLPLTLPLLAGVLIVNFHWGAAVVLGMIVVVHVVREIIGTPTERRGIRDGVEGRPG